MLGKKVSGGGEKANSEHLVYGNRQGQIEFGHLHQGLTGKPGADVTSGVFLQAADNSRHYMTMDIDGARAGWTSNRCPGPYQIWCASDHAGKTNSAPLNNWPGVGFFLLKPRILPTVAILATIFLRSDVFTSGLLILIKSLSC